MITQTQNYRFPGSSTATEVYYTMSSSSSCVAVTPASGTVSPGDTVEFSFAFSSEDCFSTVFTLSTWDDGCEAPVEYDFTLASPCASLTGTISNTPSFTNPFIFTISPSGGAAGYTVVWSYNTGLFNLLGETRGSGLSRKIELSPRFLATSTGLIQPTQTTVSATITDSNGCTETVSYTYTFCTPVASSKFVSAVCIPSQVQGGLTVGVAVGGVTLDVTTCSGTTNDWSTLELSYDTTKLYVTNTSNVLTIYGVAPSTATTYQVTYSVANTYGLRSNDATVTVSLPVCAISNSNPAILKSSTKMLTGETTGATKTLDVESITFSTDS